MPGRFRQGNGLTPSCIGAPCMTSPGRWRVADGGWLEPGWDLDGFSMDLEVDRQAWLRV